MDELAGEFAGKVKVCKLDVGQAQDLAAKYKIKVIPTLVLIENGREVQRLRGPHSREHLARWIKESLGWN